MRTVPLGGAKAAGRVALVDDEDYDLVMAHSWHLQDNPRAPHLFYAATSLKLPTGRRVHTSMHKIITGWAETDHINRDGLDNQRHNLRPVTQSQNMMNSRGRPAHRSGRFKGVYHNPDISSRYRAYIRFNGETRTLGWYDDEMSAALAYDVAARELFKEFARPNFPESFMAAYTPPQPCKHSSAYTGVSWFKARRKWRARIGERSLGYFTDEAAAGRAYDAAARVVYGPSARLNFPDVA